MILIFAAIFSIAMGILIFIDYIYDKNLSTFVLFLFISTVLLIISYFLVFFDGNASINKIVNSVINKIVNSVLYSFIIVYFLYKSYGYYSTMGVTNNNIPLGVTSGSSTSDSKIGGLIKELNEKLTKLGGMLSNKKTKKIDIEKNIKSLRQLQQLLPQKEQSNINEQINTLIGNLENFKDLKLTK